MANAKISKIEIITSCFLGGDTSTPSWLVFQPVMYCFCLGPIL